MTPRPLAKRVRRPIIIGAEGVTLVNIVAPILARIDARDTQAAQAS